MRPVTDAELPALTAFLRGRTELAMFALSNIARFGLRGGHPHATRFWAQWQNGRVVALIGQSKAGLLMPHLPAGLEGLDLSFLNGRSVSGFAGAPGEVDVLAARCGLAGAATSLSGDEPLFTLALNDLRMPDLARVAIAPLDAMPLATLHAWRRDYGVEVMGLDPATATARAVDEVASYISEDSHRILLRGDAACAMTGFNARLPDTVQVGGVYTPPALRGQGLARAAVALHLAQARDGGATCTILFAANEPAARAYRALGFQQIGAYRLSLLRDPQEVRLG